MKKQLLNSNLKALIILIYIILNFANGDWQVSNEYLVIDSCKNNLIYIHYLQKFKCAIDYFTNYLVHHVLSKKILTV